MQQSDDGDLDNLLDDALNDFEREETINHPEDHETLREAEQTLDGMQLPPEMDEFRRALLASFSSMAAMAEAPEGGVGPPEGEGEMVEAFLKDVLSKDVLYEPMREMRDKYPAWLAAHRATLPAAEMARFEQQSLLLIDICAAYEQNAPFERVAELMERISSLGQAPADMLAELAPNGAPAAPPLPGMENCAVM